MRPVVVEGDAGLCHLAEHQGAGRMGGVRRTVGHQHLVCELDDDAPRGGEGQVLDDAALPKTLLGAQVDEPPAVIGEHAVLGADQHVAGAVLKHAGAAKACKPLVRVIDTKGGPVSPRRRGMPQGDDCEEDSKQRSDGWTPCGEGESHGSCSVGLRRPL